MDASATVACNNHQQIVAALRQVTNRQPTNRPHRACAHHLMTSRGQARGYNVCHGPGQKHINCGPGDGN